MKCKKCGLENNDNAKFCSGCGATLSEAANKQAPAPENKPEKKGGVLKTVGKVVGGLVLLAMIGSCMSDNKDSKDGNNASKTGSKTSAPANTVAQLNPEQVKFLQTIGITEPTVVSEGNNSKKFTSQGNSYRLYTNDKNGITKVTKIIGDKEWSVWSDDHGKWTVPANEGKYIIIDIDNLNSQLKSNAARASKNYKGVYVKFTGLLDTIDSDGDFIGIRGNDRYAILNRFHCRLTDKKQREILLNKDTGSRITIKGRITDVGEILGYTVKVDEIQ